MMYCSLEQVYEMLEYFESVLPAKPYCCNKLGTALRIRAKKDAIKCRYIQHNTPFDLHWFVYDIDRPEAYYELPGLRIPSPNILVMNPVNYHSHFFYGLKTSVIKCTENPNVHKKPMRYAAAIDAALTMALNADPGYSGLICKNPLHKHWIPSVWETELYNLDQLAGSLNLEPYLDQRRRLPAIGLGRNCILFDLSSKFAYTQIRNTDAYPSQERFINAVTSYVAQRNREFPAPLGLSEVRAIGRSVGKWTWENMSLEGFTEWGDGRREKSIIIRKSRSEERAEEIVACKSGHPNMTNREMAAIFSVSESTVERALSASPELFDESCRWKAGNVRSIEVRQSRSEEQANAIRAYKRANPEMSNRRIAIVFAVDEKTVRTALQN